MKDKVIIKSFTNGINIIMDDQPSFEEINDLLGQKLRASRSFFGHADVALSFEGRSLSKREEMILVDTVRIHSELNVVCILDKDPASNRHYVKAIQKIQERMSKLEDGEFYKGSLENLKEIHKENSVIILGDVNPGCTVISDKNIIVFGKLAGEAHAGYMGMEGAFIAALEMEPERIKIGDFKYQTPAKKWGHKTKTNGPTMALMEDGKIVLKPLTNDILSTF